MSCQISPLLFFSLVYIISAAASPIFGFAIDKTGRNIFWVLIGTTVTLGCHAMMAFTFINPYVPMVRLSANLIMLSARLQLASGIMHLVRPFVRLSITANFFDVNNKRSP